MKAECDLCLLQLPVDDSWDGRKSMHERFHMHCLKEKRNTTEGIVKWNYIE